VHLSQVEAVAVVAAEDGATALGAQVEGQQVNGAWDK
jgi:hypothetical protein